MSDVLFGKLVSSVASPPLPFCLQTSFLMNNIDFFFGQNE